MAPKNRNSQNDFENRFFDLLEGTMDGIDKKVDSQGATLQALVRTVGNVNRKLNRHIKDHPGRASVQIPGWVTDRKLLYIFFSCVLVFLLIIAASRGVKVPGL